MSAGKRDQERQRDKDPAKRHERRKNPIKGPFVQHTQEMRESPAWRHLPDNARRLLDRLELEHMRHSGAENGNLTCTYSDFVKAGVRRASVSRAIREAAALGFLVVTCRGGRAITDTRWPSRYRLTYLRGRGKSTECTDDWRRIQSDLEAITVLAWAKEERNHGTQPRHRKNKKPDAKPELLKEARNRNSREHQSGHESAPEPDAKPELLSISTPLAGTARVNGARRQTRAAAGGSRR